MKTAIDREFCKEIRPRLEEALRKLEFEYDVKFKVGFMRYSGTSAKVAFEILQVGEDGQAETLEAVALKDPNTLQTYGLSVADLAKQLRIGGKVFTLTGFRANAPRRCFSITQVGTGKNFVTNAPAVLRALGKPVPDWLRDSI